MDWLKIMMTSHNLAWNGRAFGYAIAGKKFVVFVASVGSFVILVGSHMWSWLKRNFDFTALFVFSIPALTLFFSTLPSGITVYDIIEKYTLLIGALLGFPILIKRVSINQETLKETQKQSRASQETLKEAQEQTRISREQLHLSQISDAYGKLWSSDLGERMTAIDSLWYFAQEYPKEQYHKVMDGFTQFVKYPAPYKWEEGTKEEAKKAGERTDISAILRHMGEKRMAGAEPYWIDLREAHLEGANLWYAHLERARLGGIHLEDASLGRAHLEGADLNRAHLEGVRLRDTHLEGANLWYAHLERAHLQGTHLEGARLQGIHLEGAHLSDTHLEGANLCRAHLEGARLYYTHLTLTIINEANFLGARNLMQEQINECVFITDHPRYKQPPKLPDDIEHEYQNMTIKEWEVEIRSKF